MKDKLYYFTLHRYQNDGINIGAQIGVYPVISLWIRLPGYEIRMGIDIVKLIIKQDE